MEKVTAFILRNDNSEILLFKHRDNSIQIPSGTVESGETVEEALYREICEETGIQTSSITSVRKIDFINNDLERNELVIENFADIYSEPSFNSYKWGKLRKGITVNGVGKENDFVQIEYKEFKDETQKDIKYFTLLCWVENTSTSKLKTRHYFIVNINCEIDNYIIETDNSVFSLFWHRIKDGNICTGNQKSWFEIMLKQLHPTTAST